MNHNHMYLPQPLIAGWWLTYPSENISQMGFLFPIYGKKEGSKPPTRYCVCLTDLAKDLRENAIPCAPWTGLKLWPLSACEVSVKSVGNMGLWTTAVACCILAETFFFATRGLDHLDPPGLAVDHAKWRKVPALTRLSPQRSVGWFQHRQVMIPADGLKEKYLKPPKNVTSLVSHLH